MCRAPLAAAQSSCALRLERVMYVEVSAKRRVAVSGTECASVAANGSHLNVHDTL